MYARKRNRLLLYDAGLMKIFRHILYMVWFATAFSCRTQTEQPTEREGIADTTRIRMIQNELSKFPYINEQKEYYLQLLHLAKNTGDEYLYAQCCYELSYIYVQQANFSMTIEYLQRALRYFEAHNDKDGRANCYRVMGTVYLMLSPERADIFFQKSFELASREDSVHAVMSKNLVSILHGAKNKLDFNEIRRIDPKALTPLQQACFDYLFSTMAQLEGDTDTAMHYVLKAEDFCSKLPHQTYINALIYNRIASLHFERGDLQKAKENLAQSELICKKGNHQMIVIANMQLKSEILYAEGNEMESLLVFQEYIDTLDSFLGLNQVRSITNLLMKHLLDENLQKRLTKETFEVSKSNIAFIIILILAVIAVYYFRESFLKRREKYLMLTQISEQNFHLASSPELKQHLSVVMLEYKKGIDDYMQQVRNTGGKPEDYQTLDRQMDETNDYIDRFKKWMDEQPYQPVLISCFDALETINVIIRIHELVFHAKQMTVQNQIRNKVFAYGSQGYFGIAFEILLFQLMQGDEQNATIVLSARASDNFVTFTLASSCCVMPEEIHTILLLLIQKLKTNPKTAISLQTKFGICLKCIYENNGKFWFENKPEKGTILNFTIPRGNL